jgi:hypothetical protein
VQIPAVADILIYQPVYKAEPVEGKCFIDKSGVSIELFGCLQWFSRVAEIDIVVEIIIIESQIERFVNPFEAEKCCSGFCEIIIPFEEV